MILAVDTETTGLDFWHGTTPYFVTTCAPDGDQRFWEWDVDPFTRQVAVPAADIEEIQDLLDGADELVFHNAQFDYHALSKVGVRIDWAKVRDTMLAAHLLESNRPRNLTDVAMRWLSVDILPLERQMEDVCKAARRLVRSKAFLAEHGEWAVMKAGREDAPSAGGTGEWKADGWLPRALATALGYSDGSPPPPCTVVHLKRDEFDVRIDRKSKWGNPFVIGEDGNRAEVVEKYREWLVDQPVLLKAIAAGELDGKRLGCWCAPELCHGDVLADFASLRTSARHEYWDVTAEYANADSAVTVALWQRLKAEIDRRGLGNIYAARLPLLRIAAGMERAGVTVIGPNLDEIAGVYAEQSERAGRVCTNIAAGLGHELALPKNGVNQSLRTFLLDVLKVPPVRNKKAKTDAPTLNKEVMGGYLTHFPPNSKGAVFVRNLLGKRSRDTALAYMEGYKRYWIQCDAEGVYVLHPSLRVTGTDTLRWSSSSPNEQNISKQGMRCLSCYGGGCGACDGKGEDPRNLRYAFGPAPGREWWSLDAKNIELRLPAYLAEEPELIALYERPDDPPFFGSNHMLVFSVLWPAEWAAAVKEVGEEKAAGYCKKKYASTKYQWTKNGNFAVQYGAIDRADGGGTADRAYHLRGAHALVKSRFARLEKLNQECIRFANRHGYIETIPDRSVDPVRGYPLLCTRTEGGGVLPTVPLNFKIQGSAMWWTAAGMVRTDEYLAGVNRKVGGEHRITMQVHDEIVLDFPQGTGAEPWKTNLPKVHRVRALLEEGGKNFGIPTPVGIEYHAANWAEGVSV